jgi:hypothetical protein
MSYNAGFPRKYRIQITHINNSTAHNVILSTFVIKYNVIIDASSHIKEQCA